MPLYLDFHQLESVTLEDVKKAHMADLAVQEEFGVHFIQYWVNEEAGTIFCLMEGPDAEACMACHWASNSITPCTIQEVEPVYLKMFMGEGMPVDQDLTLTMDGKADPANRTLLLVELKRNDVKKDKHFLVPSKPKNLVVEAITKFDGRFVEHATEDSFVGVFDSPINAIRCAKNILETIQRLGHKHGENAEWNIVFRIALHQGQPLTEEEGFFEAAIQQGKRLCMIAEPNQIVLSAQLKDLLEMETESSLYPSVLSSAKVLTNPEVEFINELFELTEQNLTSESFNVNNLSHLMGMSRPQLYRKTTSLTGKSPSEFIKEIRMRKAWHLLKSKKGNISEVALEVGYSNPSHFSKIFHESFGCTPSELHASMK